MLEILITLLGIAAAIGLVIRLLLKLRQTAHRRASAPDTLFAQIKPMIEDARYEDERAIGYPQLVGKYRGHSVRLHPVIDTLAIRKLPSLWLLATIPEPLPVKATFDLMMRPAGPTTFSNFDRLPETLDSMPDAPLHAVIRTDDSDHVLPHHVVAPHLDIFQDLHAKELLITPKGLRFVWQAAEADRVRYGVFRQAEFGDVVLDAEIVRVLLDRLIALRQSILDWAKQP